MDAVESENNTTFIVKILENYGWYILISSAIILYFINLLKPKINKYFEWKNEQDYIAKYHKDPDLFSRRLEIQRNRVELLQKQHEKDAEIYQQKLKERDAKKLEEIAKKYENVNTGQKLGSSTETSKSLKPVREPRRFVPTILSPALKNKHRIQIRVRTMEELKYNQEKKLVSVSDYLHSLYYNPLMGDSSRSYRPVRKSPRGGKGCGR